MIRVGETRTGTVATFDDAKGWGSVATPEGDRYFFHCTAVADGSRTIDEGAPVSFEVVAGHRGRLEARDLRPASD